MQDDIKTPKTASGEAEDASHAQEEATGPPRRGDRNQGNTEQPSSNPTCTVSVSVYVSLHTDHFSDILDQSKQILLFCTHSKH